MFTGIVEECGRVLERDGSRLTVGADATLGGIEIGSSVAVNGVCLTAVAIGSGHLAFDLGPETLSRTALADLGPWPQPRIGPDDRPRFHHCTLQVAEGADYGARLDADARPEHHIGLDRAGETARLRIEWQGQDLAPLLIPQGSVAVDGVSLTVAALEAGAFEIMLIPHTLERTTLGALKPGRRVNLEMDVIGKYVLRVLSVRGEPR